jgi:hypothetical protein
MRIKFVGLLFSFFLVALTLPAQKNPTGIKYAVMDLHALRYYPFKIGADSIVERILDDVPQESMYDYQKTSIDYVVNINFLLEPDLFPSNWEDVIHKYGLKSYRNWLQYIRPMEDKPEILALTFFLSQDYKKEKKLEKSSNEGFFEMTGQQNLIRFWNETIGDVDLYQSKNDVLLLKVQSPLFRKNKKKYRYYLSAKKQIDEQDCYEIAFFSKNKKETAFEGYLYVAQRDSSLVKAVFTLNNFMGMNKINDVLITQSFTRKDSVTIPVKKELLLLTGDDIKGGFMANRINLYSETPWDSIPFPLTPSQTQIGNLREEAERTKAYRNTRNLLSLVMTDRIGIGNKLEIGSVSQAVSYNDIEGFRFKLGGNTTTGLNNHFLLGGYLAYGTTDKEWKYRGDLVYSFSPKEKFIREYPRSLLSFSYVSDLNVPGKDLLTSDRDFIGYSFSHTGTNNMSFQKIGKLAYEQEFANRFSFALESKYMYDQPIGLIQYDPFTASEWTGLLRYAPNEKFLQIRDRRSYSKEGDLELTLNHRLGLKGFLNGDYNYHITRLDVYKKFYLPLNAGTIKTWFSAGKVWTRLPFPLLFIPMGNHSYVFEEKHYNLMNYYEFATDQYVSGNVNFLFNWSPVRLFSPKDKIKTSLGAKVIYGPLSENNDPALHPELVGFNHGINPLGNEPYVEMNIGLSNIFKLFRVEWVHRFTYPENDLGKGRTRGSIFVTTNFAF